MVLWFDGLIICGGDWLVLRFMIVGAYLVYTDVLA